jgi:hypothetical protein
MDSSFVLSRGWRMWMPATRERRYHASLAVLAGMYSYGLLDAAQRARVDCELVEIYKPLGVYPWWRFRRDASPTGMAGDRAVAMARLGLPTQVRNLEWSDILHPWHVSSPAQLALDFRAYSEATDDAIEFLQSSGAALEAELKYGKHYLRSLRARQDA